MTSTEFNLAIIGSSSFIDRHRPLLLWIEVVLCSVGLFFFVGGSLFDGVFRPETWGTLAYATPAWVWGLANAIGAAIAAIGLVKPVKNSMIALGSGMHLMQFVAIGNSCLFWGGDIGIGIYGLALAVLHCKLFFEATKWNR